MLSSLISGGITGGAVALFSAPIEFIKVQRQLEGSKLQKNTLEWGKFIFKNHGLFGFYKGLPLHFLRDVFGTGCYFTIYETFKYASMQFLQPGPMVHLVGGGVAGALSWIVLFPIDLCKSVMQREALKPHPQYQSVFEFIKLRYSNEGIYGFYRGISPQLVRSFPVHGINFIVLEFFPMILQFILLGAALADSPDCSNISELKGQIEAYDEIISEENTILSNFITTKQEEIEPIETPEKMNAVHTILQCDKKYVADLYFYGDYIKQNTTRAFELYKELSDAGEKEGHYMVGMCYATGMGTVRDYSKAQVYLSFAALLGEKRAFQTLGYHNHAGIGMPKSCLNALFHYQQIADEAIEEWRSGPPFGKKLPPLPMKLDELQGGIYGKGASGMGNPELNMKESKLDELDLIMLYRLQAEAGDAVSQFLLAQFYYFGSAKVPVNYKKALEYFQQAAKQYPTSTKADKSEDAKHLKEVSIAASRSCGFLGQMYWRGEGVEPDIERARKWFERGVSQDNAASHYGLALMYMDGVGIPKDFARALRLLNEASTMGSNEARVLLAEQLLGNTFVDFTKVVSLLEYAAKGGYAPAYYHLSKLLGSGYPGTSPNCKNALIYAKLFVERTNWHDSTLEKADLAFKRSKFSAALAYYSIAAEQGSEIAQVNAALILDTKIAPKHPPLMYSFEKWNPYDFAIVLYHRAANQGHVDARVRVGDLYYYGFGTNGTLDDELTFKGPRLSHVIAKQIHKDIPMAPDFAQAVLHYSAAAEGEFSHSSIAMFNLGYMYEHGMGVEKDYHLAKRWYDLCLTTNPGSYLPVQIASVKLHIKWVISDLFSLWRNLFREKAKSPQSQIPGEELIEEPSNAWGNENSLIFSLVAVFLGLVWYRRLLMGMFNQRVNPPAALQ
ncbi:ERAD-associated protein [Boothiomyces macroporosus]|uniref:ERAD-associated protein n=1 Tax=Boothiomyces macroporosus TaxID=261099 RepID=A0AAD5Y9M0_9FUNG|nr:ERAD-associated protein [Boothiomyces macroporosus]